MSPTSGAADECRLIHYPPRAPDLDVYRADLAAALEPEIREAIDRGVPDGTLDKLTAAILALIRRGEVEP